jgi:hypothetical protein
MFSTLFSLIYAHFSFPRFSGRLVINFKQQQDSGVSLSPVKENKHNA